VFHGISDLMRNAFLMIRVRIATFDCIIQAFEIVRAENQNRLNPSSFKLILHKISYGLQEIENLK
jgi:hypothetical protein